MKYIIAGNIQDYKDFLRSTATKSKDAIYLYEENQIKGIEKEIGHTNTFFVGKYKNNPLYDKINRLLYEWRAEQWRLECEEEDKKRKVKKHEKVFEGSFK